MQLIENGTKKQQLFKYFSRYHSYVGDALANRAGNLVYDT